MNKRCKQNYSVISNAFYQIIKIAGENYYGVQLKILSRFCMMHLFGTFI